MKKTWTNCWLEYPLIQDQPDVTITVASEWDGVIINRAYHELKRGLESLYHCQVTQAVVTTADIRFLKDPGLSAEGYTINAKKDSCTISAGDEKGILYGSFALLRQLQIAQCPLHELTWQETKVPSNPLRLMIHWDNLPGDIERGYAGDSLFFKNNHILVNERSIDYARLAASAGFNGLVINNSNVAGAAIELISDRFYAPLSRLQEIFHQYGLKLFIAVDFTMPMLMGDLETADPTDPDVQSWWQRKAKEVWENLPGLGGFMVKADSEGRPGPYAYGKNHADGANMLADAVAPYGGLILWRCFVYDCQQDWRDTVTDRAKAGYDHYMPLDGCFRDNVVLEIKNGPMDFQVREPVSPLIGGLAKTQMLLEVQITQEYTGQQRHVCYLLPWFRQILDQDMCCWEGPSKVSDLIQGKRCGKPLGGISAIANTGNDPNWTGHDLAAANFYGIGRLAFDISLSPETIAREWIRLTYGDQPKVEEVLFDILMNSWPVYEKYNAPLGIGWMCNPGFHYGPNPNGYEYSRWGTYHRADHQALGIDRTTAGTGYTAQYAPNLQKLYEDVETCPEEMILFFHRLPYSYMLKTGKNILQHIYDTHFEGAEQAAQFLSRIEGLAGLLPDDVYARMHERFTLQKENAEEWRDVVNTFFYRMTGIPDEHGRTIYP
ncbi:MAG: alpha-glucuronidase [Blautia sp.]|nr:alpha-glucuronidase [Blautia sp.]